LGFYCSTAHETPGYETVFNELPEFHSKNSSQEAFIRLCVNALVYMSILKVLDFVGPFGEGPERGFRIVPVEEVLHYLRAADGRHPNVRGVGHPPGEGVLEEFCYLRAVDAKEFSEVSLDVDRGV